MKKTILEQKTKDYKNYGLFSFSGLQGGMGLTLGNTLKRILLNNIVGTAFTKIKYNTTLSDLKKNCFNYNGILENCFEINFNIKKIVLKNLYIKSGFAELSVTGPKIVTANDIILPNFISVVNKNLYLFTLEKNKTINFDLFFESGFNYKLSEVSSDDNWSVLDSKFCPILKVNFNIKLKKNIDKNNIEEIVYFEIWTNGSITANEAISEAFVLLSNLCIDGLI